MYVCMRVCNVCMCECVVYICMYVWAHMPIVLQENLFSCPRIYHTWHVFHNRLNPSPSWVLVSALGTHRQNLKPCRGQPWFTRCDHPNATQISQLKHNWWHSWVPDIPNSHIGPSALNYITVAIITVTFSGYPSLTVVQCSGCVCFLHSSSHWCVY